MVIVTLIYIITTNKTRFKHPPHPLWHNARGEKKLNSMERKEHCTLKFKNSNENLMTYTGCGKTPCLNFVR
jgi:hypothetical protein